MRILITGAKSGIGLEIVKQLLHHRTNCPELIIATVRRISDARELSDLANRSNYKLRILELDLNDFNNYGAFADQVANLVGPGGLNVIWHNAGVNFDAPTIEDATLDNLSSHLKINTIAPILLTKALLPMVRQAARLNSSKPIGVDRAAIIYTSSQLGSILNNTTGGYWGYRESKAAGNMAMVSLKGELQKDGIATLMLHPGWVQTKIGGSSAALTAAQSAAGLISVALTLNDNLNGRFVQWDWKPLPW